MAKRIIRLCYRKIIDSSSNKVWDKYVFENSYKELLMQFQFYNQEKKYTSFADLTLNVPAAEKLHFLVSASVTGFVQQLKNKIPDIVNSLGRQCLQFENFRFEIINSAINNNATHQIAINFYCKPLLWHDTVGHYLLVSGTDETSNEDGVLTEMIPMQPFLSIYSVKEVL